MHSSKSVDDDKSSSRSAESDSNDETPKESPKPPKRKRSRSVDVDGGDETAGHEEFTMEDPAGETEPPADVVEVDVKDEDYDPAAGVLSCCEHFF